VKLVRTHAFAAPAVGVWLWPDELAALAGLPAWFVALFVALLQRADFKTGAGRTGYGELANCLTPDQPERGPRLWAPSRDDIKAALRRLESLRVLAVDKLRSEQLQTINFLVRPRVAQRVPAGKLPRQLPPGSTEGKGAKLPPVTPPALSALNTYPPTSQAPKLSTARTAEVRAKLAQVRDAIDGARGGRNRAPKGA
jgi:hypothetical protein